MCGKVGGAPRSNTTILPFTSTLEPPAKEFEPFRVIEEPTPSFALRLSAAIVPVVEIFAILYELFLILSALLQLKICFAATHT